MKSQYLISDFSAGELSPRIFTRGFAEKYRSGLEECTGFTILPQGGAFKTPGFEHVLSAYAATSTRGIPFSMAHEDDIDIDLELGNQYMRIVKDGTVINSGSNITTPWTTAQLRDIQFAQDGNEMWLVHGSHAPRLLTRTSDASWALSTPTLTPPQVAFDDASSPSPSPSAFTLTEGGTWATGEYFTLVIDSGGLAAYTDPIYWSATFASLVLNVYNKIYSALVATGLSYVFGYPTFSVAETTDPEMEIVFTGNWAWLGDVIVDVVASSSGTMTDAGSAGTGSTEDAWSATRGYPRTVAFHEQRLMFGGTVSLPNWVWGSASGQPTVFTLGSNDDDPFAFQLQGGRQGVAIQWMESSTLLVLGTSYGDHVQNAVPMTPTNVDFKRQNARRSAYLQPVAADVDIFYVQRGRKRLRSVAFEFGTQRWQSVDATFLADHMANGAILELGYVENPDPVVYAVTEDAYLICLTYDRANQVGAWWRRVSPADILSAWTIHNPTTGLDEIHALVEYGSSRYLWKMRATSERVLVDEKSGSGIIRNQQSGNIDGYLDGFVTTSAGTAFTAIGSLPWPDGTTVEVVGDDALQADQTVASGAITAAQAALNFVVGLPYTSKLKTLPLEGGNPGGTSQAKKRRFIPTLRVVSSFPPLVNGYRAPDRPVNALMDAAAPLVNGDLENLNLGHGDQGQLTIEADKALPCQITGIFGDIAVGGG